MTATTIAALTDLARQCQVELDGGIAAWRMREGANLRLWCGPGCGNCCTLAVNATLPEALAIAGRIDPGQRQQLVSTAARIITHARESSETRQFLSGYRKAIGPCPFLGGDGNCRVYAARPLACRALLATRPPDWCGVNLGQLPPVERDAFLASLDRTAVAFPTHYAAEPQALAADLERELLLAMRRLTGYGLTGSLPLLVWLTGRNRFAEALTGGTEALAPFLAEHGADHPCLAQVHLP
jgi:Fe-S-cluster containining protein